MLIPIKQLSSAFYFGIAKGIRLDWEQRGRQERWKLQLILLAGT